MKRKVRVALAFKDFAAWLRSSCTGLNVAGFATAEVLKEAGIDVTVFPVRHNIDLVYAIDGYKEEHGEPLTHVIISAPWLSVHDLRSLLEHFPYIHFVVLSHSNVGFLQADFEGVRLLRQYIHLSQEHSNLSVGGNSERFVEWLRETFHRDAVLLPNLYPLARTKMKPAPVPKDGLPTQTIKIGAFGAVRPQKNFMTAAAAAVSIQRHLKVPVEFHMSVGGEEGGNFTSLAIEQMLEESGVTLIRHPWRYWDDFIEVVGSMDLLIQVSYTESFNMITADGINAGVPSVVSPAISWAPFLWTADPDNAKEVAHVGLSLLRQDETRQLGISALKAHDAWGLSVWEGFFHAVENDSCEEKGLWQIVKSLFKRR
jgi:glycosyltransferase involved in cell wall biosynthesis